MNEQELEDLHKLVWDFRAVAGEYWPTPNVADALKYAFTESGEAIDALLVEKRPNDKRNRDKDADRLDEWADCAMMLITALPGFEWFYLGTPLYSAPSQEMLSLRVAVHMYTADSHEDIHTTINMISLLPGMDLRARIVGRLQRIMHKHLPFQLWPEGQALLDVHKVFDPTKV